MRVCLVESGHHHLIENLLQLLSWIKQQSLTHSFIFFIGKLEYQAQSPDEGALVSAARNFGFVFKVIYMYI